MGRVNLMSQRTDSERFQWLEKVCPLKRETPWLSACVHFHFWQMSLKQAKNSFRCQTSINQGADIGTQLIHFMRESLVPTIDKAATECEYCQLVNQQDVHQSALMADLKEWKK